MLLLQGSVVLIGVGIQASSVKDALQKGENDYKWLLLYHTIYCYINSSLDESEARCTGHARGDPLQL